MNVKQIVSAGLMLLVALSVGALLVQKSRGPVRDGADPAGLATVETGVAVVQDEPAAPREEPVAASPSSVAESAPTMGAKPAASHVATATAAVPPRQDPPAAPPSAAVAPPPVQALYLHGTFRCETCNSIEEQAKRAITEDFAAQIQAGGLQFASLNMDKEPHTHYGDDFQLTSASLVLTDGRGPKGRWKVLERTWELVKDPVAFREYVGTETRAFLAATGGQ